MTIRALVSSQHTSYMMLPIDVMDLVLRYCDRASCRALMLSCPDYHDSAAAHIYENIVISTAKQLRSLDRTIKMAKSDGTSRFFCTFPVRSWLMTGLSPQHA